MGSLFPWIFITISFLFLVYIFDGSSNERLIHKRRLQHFTTFLDFIEADKAEKLETPDFDGMTESETNAELDRLETERQKASKNNRLGILARLGQRPTRTTAFAESASTNLGLGQTNVPKSHHDRDDCAAMGFIRLSAEYSECRARLDVIARLDNEEKARIQTVERLIAEEKARLIVIARLDAEEKARLEVIKSLEAREKALSRK